MSKDYDAIERQLATAAAARSLSPSAFLAWQGSRYTECLMMRQNSILVLWEWFLDGPRILDHVMLEAIHLHQAEGLAMVLRHSDKTKIVISHNPVSVFDNRVFAHIPRALWFNFLPNSKGISTVSIPLVVKTESASFHKEEKCINVSQLGKFRSDFPQFKGVYL